MLFVLFTIKIDEQLIPVGFSTIEDFLIDLTVKAAFKKILI